MNRHALLEILQTYIGMTPKDKGCNSWNQMQEKLADEIVNLSKEKITFLPYGTKVYVDTKTIAAKCNYSKIKYQRDALIKSYNAIDNTYTCQKINETFASFQITPIE